jgi:hypothetical protein
MHSSSTTHTHCHTAHSGCDNVSVSVTSDTIAAGVVIEAEQMSSRSNRLTVTAVLQPVLYCDELFSE